MVAVDMSKRLAGVVGAALGAVTMVMSSGTVSARGPVLASDLRIVPVPNASDLGPGLEGDAAEAVAPLSGIVEIEAGNRHTCARLAGGTAKCWGWNAYGQLGDGTTADRVTPVTVKNPAGTGPLTGIVELDTGWYHSCARLVDGTARCWGLGGPLGDGTSDGRSLPAAVMNPAGTGLLTEIVEIDAGGNHTCARSAKATAFCWGYNYFGGVGDGTTTDRFLPVVVKNPAGTGPLAGVTEIVAGAGHSCAVLADRTARCWGYNANGEVGDGTRTSRFLPVVVKNPAGTGPLAGVTEIVAGAGHSCAVLADGTARCWGYNPEGALGDGTRTDRLRPVIVRGSSGVGSLMGITRVRTRGYHSCGRVADGTVRCWGDNAFGQVGDGATGVDRLLPVTVKNPAGTRPLTNVTHLAAGEYHTCAVLADTTARCWGYNGFGQLGNGSTVNRQLPVTVKRGT